MLQLTSLFQDSRPLKWEYVCLLCELIIIISFYSHVVDSLPTRSWILKWDTVSLNSRTQQELIGTPLFASTRKTIILISLLLLACEEQIYKCMQPTGFISTMIRTSLIYFLTMHRNGSSFYENDYHKKDVGWSRGMLYDTRDHHYVPAVRTFILLSFT